MTCELFGKLIVGQSLLIAGMAVPAIAEEQPPTGGEGVRMAVPSELGDVARALRGLDQSYTFRGMRGCGSATAGSVSIDWVARGIAPADRFQPVPPQPLVLSEAPAPGASPPVSVTPTPVAPPVMMPAPQLPALPESTPHALPVAPNAYPAAPAPAVGYPCPVCGTTAAPSPVIDPVPVVTQPMMSLPFASQSAEVVGYDHSAGYSSGFGRTPPHAMRVNGVWVESTSPASGCGLAPIYYGRPSGRVW